MQVQLFENQTISPLPPRQVQDNNEAQEAEFQEFETSLLLEDLDARIKICKQLRLTAQLKELVPIYNAHALKATIPFPFLSKDEERILKRLFPTTYANAAEDSSSGRTLAEYKFDVLPLPVLETWQRCVEQRLFHRYEIWTAEQIQKPDPLLIGRRNEHPRPYLLARWADGLRPLPELAKEIGSVRVVSFDDEQAWIRMGSARSISSGESISESYGISRSESTSRSRTTGFSRGGRA